MGNPYGPSGLYFRKTPSGRIAFYAWGILGKGYITPNEKSRKALARFFNSYMAISIPLVFVADRYIGWHVAIAALAVLIPGYQIGIRVIARGFARTPERLTLGEWCRTHADDHGYFFHSTLGLFSLLVFAGGVFMMVVIAQKAFLSVPRRPLSARFYEDALAALVCIVIFGYGMLHFALMIRAKMSARSQENSDDPMPGGRGARH